MGINVLSLFDGMSCGQIALNRVGIKYDNYFASEIEPNAIKVTQHNYPNTIHIGDIKNISYKEGKLYKNNEIIFEGKIDLLIGGSPCTNLSSAGDKSGLIVSSLQDYYNLKQADYDFGTNTSFLFWEYCRLLSEVNPEYFLLENVKMKKHYEDLITNTLNNIRNKEIKPIMINANLVSAQDRKRLYWTDIGEIQQPENKNLKIKDILDEVEDSKYDVTVRYLKKVPGTLAFKKARGNRRTIEQTSKTLTTSGHCISNSGSTNIYYSDEKIRIPSPTECERLQTVPVGYTSCIKDRWRYHALGNGWCVDVIAHIFKGLLDENL